MALPPLTPALLEHAYAHATDALLAVSVVEPRGEDAGAAYAGAPRTAGSSPQSRASPQLRVRWANAAARRLLGAYSSGAPDTTALLAAEPALAERLAAATAADKSGLKPGACVLPLRTAGLLIKATPCKWLPDEKPPLGRGQETGGGEARAPAAAASAAPARKAAGFFSSCFRPSPAATQQQHEAEPDSSDSGWDDRTLTLATALLHASLLEPHGDEPAAAAPASSLSRSNSCGSGRPAALGVSALSIAVSGLTEACSTVLGGLPLCVTVVAADGHVLLQNAASMEYYGDRVKTEIHAGADEDVLAQLFVLERGKLAAMRAHTLEGGGAANAGVWEAIVQVPTSMNPNRNPGSSAACSSGGTSCAPGRNGPNSSCEDAVQVRAAEQLPGSIAGVLAAAADGGMPPGATARGAKPPLHIQTENSASNCALSFSHLATMDHDAVGTRDVSLQLKPFLPRGPSKSCETPDDDGGMLGSLRWHGVGSSDGHSSNTLHQDLDSDAPGQDGIDRDASLHPTARFSSGPGLGRRVLLARSSSCMADSGGGGGSPLGSSLGTRKTSAHRFKTTDAFATSTWQVLLNSRDEYSSIPKATAASMGATSDTVSSNRGTKSFSQPRTAATPMALWCDESGGDMCTRPTNGQAIADAKPSCIGTSASVSANACASANASASAYASAGGSTSANASTEASAAAGASGDANASGRANANTSASILGNGVIGGGRLDARQSQPSCYEEGMLDRSVSMRSPGWRSPVLSSQEGSVPRVLAFANSLKSMRSSSLVQSSDGPPPPPGGLDSPLDTRHTQGRRSSLRAHTEAGDQGPCLAAGNVTHEPTFAPRLEGEAVPAADGLPYAWHEVRVTGAQDPATGERYVIVLQKDVTPKVEAERHILQVSEAEHRLLEQIFPRHVLQYMSDQPFMPLPANGSPPISEALPGLSAAGRCAGPAPWRPYVQDCARLATSHKKVTILFCDIQGFTPMCGTVSPAAVMRFLNELFVLFDAQLDAHNVYKVETIGDCYVVAGGLIREDRDGMAAVWDGDEVDEWQADKVFAFAKAMLRAAARVTLPTSPSQPCNIRIGIHTGPAMSGVVGTRQPRFCIFGDTMNTASRMESSGVPGCIHASEATYGLLRGKPGWAPTGGIEVKGKGSMNTYLWTPAQQ